MQTIIEIKNLCKKYANFNLRDINLSLPSGTIMGLMGENGAGKTTTIKLILNIIRRDSGLIKIFGADNIEQEQLVKEKIGVVLDSCFFHDCLTANNISFILSGIYRSWNKQAFIGYLGQFNVPAHRKIKELSRGMKTKLMVATALSHSPKLLILDEATTGLDPVSRDELLSILKDFVVDNNRAVLFSTHITSDVEKIADHVTFIKKGEIALSASKADLLSRYQFLELTQDQYSKVRLEHILYHYVTSSPSKCERPYSIIINTDIYNQFYTAWQAKVPSLDEFMVSIARGVDSECGV